MLLGGRGEFAQVGDPVVGLGLGEFLRVAVTVGGDADLDAGGPRGGDVGRGIPDHQAVFRVRSERGQGCQDDIRRGFAGEAVSALHGIEEAEKAELLEHVTGGGVPLVVAVDFRPASCAKPSTTPG